MQFTSFERGMNDMGSVELKLCVSSADVSEMLQEVYKTIRDYLKLPASATPEEIEQEASLSMPKDYFKELLRDYVVNKAVAAAVAKEGLKPALTPQIRAIEYPKEGAEFAFDVAITERPEISLSSYEPVEVEIEKPVDLDVLVAAHTVELLEKFTQYADDEPHPVRARDCFMAEISTILGGKAYMPLTGMDFRIDLSDGTYAPEFLNNVVGMKIGEKKTFEFRVPRERAISDNDVDLYVCTITPKKQLIKTEAELTDEFVKENFPPCTTVKEFFTELRADLVSDMQKERKERIARLCNNEIAKRLVGSIPDQYFQVARVQMRNKFDEDLKKKNISIDEYFEQAETNEEELNMQMLIKVAENLHQSFALEALFDGAGMQFEGDDLKKACKMVFHTDDFDEEEYRAKGKLNIVESAAKRVKALNWLTSTAIVKEIEPVDEDTPAQEVSGE